MLLVDGSLTANVTVWSQTVSVQPGKAYTLSVWGASNYNYSPASIQFQINGSAVDPPKTFSTTTGQWSNYSAVWNAGPATEATIAFIDLNTTFSGNDFALDDISFNPVPEPTGLFFSGIGMVMWIACRRRLRGHQQYNQSG
jgi:hypothetical protein